MRENFIVLKRTTNGRPYGDKGVIVCAVEILSFGDGQPQVAPTAVWVDCLYGGNLLLCNGRPMVAPTVGKVGCLCGENSVFCPRRFRCFASPYGFDYRLRLSLRMTRGSNGRPMVAPTIIRGDWLCGGNVIAL